MVEKQPIWLHRLWQNHCQRVWNRWYRDIWFSEVDNYDLPAIFVRELIFSCDQAALWLVQSVCPSASRAGFCAGNWSSLSLPVRTCIILWWEFQWSNKWNWYSSGLNASILAWHACASAISGWVLHRQLELTKLTRPDLHHVVALFILRDVRPSQLFHYVSIIISLCICQELLPWTEVMSMQTVKVRGQRSKSLWSKPNLAVSGL